MVIMKNGNIISREIQLDILAKYQAIITLLQESRKDLEKLNQMLDKGDKNGKV